MELFNMLSRDAVIVDLYKGDCKGCGECCGRFIPLSKFDAIRLRGYLESHRVEMRPEQAEYDLMCPFLSNEHECMVYEARPEVCRTYRCDMHKAGKLKPFRGLGDARMYDMRAKFKECCE